MRVIFQDFVLFIVFIGMLLMPSKPITPNRAWVRLATLWNAPGRIIDIGADSAFAIIGHNFTSTSKLVRIATGEIVDEVTYGEIRFSRSGHYAVSYEYRSGEFTINNLQTGRSIDFEGTFGGFVANEVYVSVLHRNEDIGVMLEQLVVVETGEVIAEFTHAVVFNTDASLVAVTDVHDRANILTQIFDLATGAVVAEFRGSVGGEGGWGAYTVFHVSGPYLSIYYFPEELHIISTETWEQLYTLPGGIFFSPDGRYIAANNHAGYSDVQLVDAQTGEILDEFLGWLSFSRDGRFIYRGEAVNYDIRDIRILDINTHETVFRQVGRFDIGGFYTQDIVYFLNHETRSTQFFNIITGDRIRDIRGYVQTFGEVILIDEIGLPFFSSLRDIHSLEVYAIGQDIEFTPDERYALVSNGYFVDVYGLPESRLATMPAPRPHEGFARAEQGELTLFVTPDLNDPQPIDDVNLHNRTTYFYVLGRTAQQDWLYVVGEGLSDVWIPADTLTEIVSWENVPVVDELNPITSLQSIAIYSH